MADCELLKGCAFFHDRMGNMPGTAELMKKRYCQGSNAECARYVVFKAKGREAVPSDLFPNRIEKAREIVGK